MTFRFKQFSVNDDMSSIKIGTDAVLLGAWVGTGSLQSMLDIGTGCGIIALMMAQRYNKTMIHGIDIHDGSVIQARDNFRLSPWAYNLSAQKISLQDYSTGTKRVFDLIVSNPPYFKDSLLPPDPSRELARHTTSLSFEELVKCSSSLLSDKGRLAMILPYENKKLISGIMKKFNLYLQRELDIIPIRGKEPNRFLSEWGKTNTQCQSGSLIIRNDTHSYSEEYVELTKEFYLAL